ncbi:protein NATD1 isoform X2 [Colossoma macropomum]|uniref:protein NATD1 isoform X2 n=1 Tax=Colossoma macropomum TaxID=42526 RepID=UPI001863EC0F|nr:protein NATD1 isoform X2 [Colossoma macropomum]
MLSRNCLCNLRRAQRLTAVKLSESPFCGLSTEAHRVIHDRQQRCFVVRLGGGGPEDSAVLKYSYRTDRHVQLLSTVVPESFRGKGVAAQLAKAALDFVAEEQLKATISCWYIKKYVKENPHHGYQAYIED